MSFCQTLVKNDYLTFFLSYLMEKKICKIKQIYFIFLLKQACNHFVQFFCSQIFSLQNENCRVTTFERINRQ